MEELGYSAALAWVIPLVVSLLKAGWWPTWAKVTLAALASLGIATVAGFMSGAISLVDVHDGGAWLGAAGVAFTEATVIYKVILRGSRIDEALTQALWNEQ